MSHTPRKLLISPAIDDVRLAKIVDAAQPMTVVNARDLDAALQEIEDADAFYGKITPDLLSRAKRLTWVQSPTASLEHYVFDELIAHPCRLSNMRGLFSDVIADHVLGLMLCFARNLHVYLRNQASGNWAPVGDPGAVTDFVTSPGTETPVDRAHRRLADCSLGVVGAGAIGAEICRRAACFGMRIVAVDPVARTVPGLSVDVWPTLELPRLLAGSDFVVIAAPHTPETYKLFRAAQFVQMKSTAYLINIGRGAIVDLQDLTRALVERQIAGAALDVAEIEPLPAEHPLWRMPNVIITPHVAAASPIVPERHLETLLENIRRFVAGEDPLTLVDKRRWY